MLIIHERTLPNRFFWLSLCHPAMPCNCFSTRTKPEPFVVTSICQPYCNISLTHTRQSAVDFMPIKAFECQDFTQGIPVAMQLRRVGFYCRAREAEKEERKKLVRHLISTIHLSLDSQVSSILASALPTLDLVC